MRSMNKAKTLRPWTPMAKGVRWMGSNKTELSRLRRRFWHTAVTPLSAATQPQQSKMRKTTYTADNNTQRTCYEFTYKVTRPVGDPAPGLFGRSEERKEAGMSATPPLPLPAADNAAGAVGERTAEMVAEVLEQTRALATRVNSEERRLAHANARLDYMLVTSWLGDILLFALLGLVVWAGPWWYLREMESARAKGKIW
jgi:hypothetical protein